MGFELIMELRTVFMNAFHKYMHAPLKLPTSGYIMIHLLKMQESYGIVYRLVSKISFEYSEQFVLHTTVK